MNRQSRLRSRDESADEAGPPAKRPALADPEREFRLACAFADTGTGEETKTIQVKAAGYQPPFRMIPSTGPVNQRFGFMGHNANITPVGSGGRMRMNGIPGPQKFTTVGPNWITDEDHGNAVHPYHAAVLVPTVEGDNSSADKGLMAAGLVKDDICFIEHDPTGGNTIAVKTFCLSLMNEYHAQNSRHTVGVHALRNKFRFYGKLDNLNSEMGDSFGERIYSLGTRVCAFHTAGETQMINWWAALPYGLRTGAKLCVLLMLVDMRIPYDQLRNPDLWDPDQYWAPYQDPAKNDEHFHSNRIKARAIFAKKHRKQLDILYEDVVQKRAKELAEEKSTNIATTDSVSAEEANYRWQLIPFVTTDPARVNHKTAYCRRLGVQGHCYYIGMVTNAIGGIMPESELGDADTNRLIASHARVDKLASFMSHLRDKDDTANREACIKQIQQLPRVRVLLSGGLPSVRLTCT